MQKWKTDPKLYDCKRDEKNKKVLKYDYFIENFISADPVRDWESIAGCINLFQFFKIKVGFKGEKILDAGTKDGQMTDYLNSLNYDCIGIEIDQQYIDFAQSKNRKVLYGNICDMEFKDNTFDLVFSHHVLGLCPDYKKAYQEMLRVCKPNGYIVTLNQIPGNKRKHYSLILDPREINYMLSDCPKHQKIFFDYTNKNKNEFTIILKKE